MNVKKILLLSATLILTSTSFAKTAKKAPADKWKNMSKEDRAKMADMHMKMAECLKSDKDMSECHKEMMDSCKGMDGGCPMMGKGEGMHHKMMDKMDEKKEEMKEGMKKE